MSNGRVSTFGPIVAIEISLPVLGPLVSRNRTPAVPQIARFWPDGQSILFSMISGPQLRAKRRRSALLFMGGMSGLMASYAVAFTITYLAQRGL